jgi:hypothetical protein
VSTPRDRRYSSNPGLKPVAPAPLPTLRKRMHVRVVVPPTVTLYARVKASANARAHHRAFVNDVSAAGMGLTIIEAGRYELLHEDQEITVDLDFEGTEARVAGRVVRVDANQHLSVAYPPEPRDATINYDLLALVAQVVTQNVDFVDGRRHAGSLRARLAHRHFSSAGYLDVHVQVDAPAWWQIVFLEYLASWSELDGFETGILDRSHSNQPPSDALAIRSNVTRHPAPWPSLLRLSNLIAGQCLAALPTHAADFALLQRTLAKAL